ncbi:hypothetical protein CFC21_002159 [Triticum aestivum]|uniref:Uncharacterized protein n=3 Tax=Triticum TaxID=4564 RepID=A0A9R0UWN8_TRITD|nr:expansin-B9-like [Triticum dicoccoides]XP_044407929.1 expansin-B9-like [Triticum aestivum]XP_048553121.1 expansin-B9-like [Triticum urartu]KAF6984109.1 hypothetical protein CFC21_002159 [Triticum aestivum]VAH06050.1 unnamed protein product [Triticum turgidum subsp. durum]
MGSVSYVLAAAVLAALVSGGACIPSVPPGPNITTNYNNQWLPAKATWYGKPTGSGPKDNGGACGIKDVNLAPYNGMIACGNVPIFKDGKGCGSCYEIKCQKPSPCSDKPVTIFITDKNYEPIAPYHIDLSGKAFGAMAPPGKEQTLRSFGELELQFRRVRCKYAPGTKITFHVEKGSNPNYLAVLVKFVSDDGDVVQMDIQQSKSPAWIPLTLSWGAIWRWDGATPLKGPFSIRVTSESGKKLIAKDVIPANWKADTVYPSNIQF